MTICVNRVRSLIVCSQFFGPCSPKPLHFSITLLRLCLRAFNRFNCVSTKSLFLWKRQKTQGALLKIACNFCRRGYGKIYLVLHTYFWLMVKFFIPNLGVDGLQNMFALDGGCIYHIYIKRQSVDNGLAGWA